MPLALAAARPPLVAGLYHVEAVDAGRVPTACDDRPVHAFAPRNRWLYSHQPGLWRREFLLGGGAARRAAVLVPGENPWLNELRGSERAEPSHARVALVTAEWAVAVSSSGQLNAGGELMEMAMRAAEEEARGGGRYRGASRRASSGDEQGCAPS